MNISYREAKRILSKQEEAREVINSYRGMETLGKRLQLKNNKEMNKSFGKDTINSFVKLRSSEIKEFNRKEKFNKSKPVTKWESQNTLDC